MSQKNKRLAAILKRPTARRKRIMSRRRVSEIRRCIFEVRQALARYGFRIEPAGDAVGPYLAILDEREERPPDWNVAAYADAIGPNGVKEFDPQIFAPPDMR